MDGRNDQELSFRREGQSEELDVQAIDRKVTSSARRFAASIGDPAIDSEDLKQSAWVKYLGRQLHREGIENFAAWFYVTLHGLAIDQARAARKLPLVYFDHPSRESEEEGDRWATVPSGAKDPQAMLEDEELRAKIEEYVAKLQPKDRLKFLLKGDDLKAREIAAALGISRLEVYAANQKFKKELRKLCGL
jgi:RNA polymerase sigma factor (sigma-70 family)